MNEINFPTLDNVGSAREEFKKVNDLVKNKLRSYHNLGNSLSEEDLTSLTELLQMFSMVKDPSNLISYYSGFFIAKLESRFDKKPIKDEDIDMLIPPMHGQQPDISGGYV